MLKIQIEGKTEIVEPFLCDFTHRSQMEMVTQEKRFISGEDEEKVSVTCYVRYAPDRRLTKVEMITPEGKMIRIPLLDLIYVELREGNHIFSGKVFDIFA
jgi:hypothetical protein